VQAFFDKKWGAKRAVEGWKKILPRRTMVSFQKKDEKILN
jgi:hypothetical protein